MTDLTELRKEIDSIDEQIVELFARRFAVTEKVGQYKVANGIPLVDKVREASQEERIVELAKRANIDPVFAKQMLRLVIDTVVRRHQQLAKEATNE